MPLLFMPSSVKKNVKVAWNDFIKFLNYVKQDNFFFKERVCAVLAFSDDF